MKNDVIQKISKQVMDEVHLPEAEFGSVIVVLMITSIIVSAIRVLQECNKQTLILPRKDRITFYNKQIKTLSNDRGWFTKMRLKKIIRKNMKQQEYKIYGNQILEALLNIGEKLSIEDTAVIMDATEKFGH